MLPLEKEYGLETIKGLVEGDKNLSRIFGFILYTEQHPFMVKVLQDSAYWKALDSISGPNWPIFAVRPLEKGYYGCPRSRGNEKHMMIHTWNEPQTNLPILQDFDLKSSNELPCFVAFMWDDNDNLKRISIPISGNNTESVYNSIEEIVRVVAETEKNVLPEYKHNVELFDNVSKNLEALKCKHTLKTIMHTGWKFIEFFKSFV